MQIQISWLLQKPTDLTDLDLHCLQMQGISRISRTRVKHWDAMTSYHICPKKSITQFYYLMMMCLQLLDYVAKSVIPDQILCSVASVMDLLCLHRPSVPYYSR